MGYEYAAKPDYDPSGPDIDGFADIHVHRNSVEFTLKGGETVTLPGLTIQKGTFRMEPGGNDQVNILGMKFLAGKVTFDEEVDVWTEVVPDKKRCAEWWADAAAAAGTDA